METKNQMIPVDLTGAPWIECCGGPAVFEISYMLKRVSSFHLGNSTGKDQIVPVEMIICKKCGKVPAHLAKLIADLPKEMVGE